MRDDSGSVAVAPVQEFSAEQIAKWRRQVMDHRMVLFQRNWKNRRQIIALRSRIDEANFQFAVEWCEEFGDVVGRQKERNRLDKLIELGVDVNLPREQQPDV